MILKRRTEPIAQAAGETTETNAADVPPDRLSVNPRNKLFDSDLLQRGVGIRFKGSERTNVEEYCISEGWVKVQAGKTMDRKGNPLTLKLNGPVEAWFEDLGDDPPVAKACPCPFSRTAIPPRSGDRSVCFVRVEYARPDLATLAVGLRWIDGAGFLSNPAKA